MNILGFNPSHHGSVCLLQDGEIKYFIQEERIGNREKYAGYPFRSFIDILEKYQIDSIITATPGLKYPSNQRELENKDSNYWEILACSYNPKIKAYDGSQTLHHKAHAAHAFYNSGFKEALAIIIDGLGSPATADGLVLGQETETIFECSYPAIFTPIYKSHSRLYGKYPVTLCRAYETINKILGWSVNDSGKTMGLAPYGKFNSNFPPFFNDCHAEYVFYQKDKIIDDHISYLNYEINLDTENFPQLQTTVDPKEWHNDESKITDLEKDLAWHVQDGIQKTVASLVEKSIKQTGIKKICCSGGFFLNCVSNYYLTKQFPDVEFYFEPIANDAGISIGAAKGLWHDTTKDTTIRPFKSLYLGKEYSKDELLKGISKYVDK